MERCTESLEGDAVADAEAAYAAALTDGDAEGPSRRSVCKEPVALAALHESGKLHCAHGRYLEALGCFERAVALAPPEAARALRLRVAWCSWQLGSHEKAEALYTSLLEVHPVCAQVGCHASNNLSRVTTLPGVQLAFSNHDSFSTSFALAPRSVH